MFGHFLIALLLVPLTLAQSQRPWWFWCRIYPQACTQPNPNRCCPRGGIWGAWKAKTDCTDVCGAFGTQVVERTCLTQSRGCGPCNGPTQKTVRCNPTPCPFPRMSCADGLKAGTKDNQILCIDPNEVPEQIQRASCCPAGGITETTDWSSCNTARCGTCDVQTRTKVCRTKAYGCGECSEQEQQETRPCVTTPCKFPQQSCCAGFKAQVLNNQILCA